MLLDERKQRILGAVVRDYVETVKPIGSEELVSRYSWGVKSATIRNELAELADLGLLRQPHTSAGRIPSDLGYRFYVDHLMVVRQVDTLSTSTTHELDHALELDRLLRQTCALLTRMTSYTSVATPPRPADTTLTHIFVSPAGDNRMLVVVLLSAGQVENRLLSDIPDTSAGEIIALNQALNAAFVGKTLDTINAAPSQARPQVPAEFAPATRNLYDTLTSAIRQMALSASEDDSVFLEGTSEILRQPEFRDVTKIENVFASLQRGTALFQTLSQAILGSDVTVVIGAENHVEAMQECSVVTASYFIGTRERGTIGVVGPTRMDYDKAVPAVQFFARALSQTLTRLGAS